MKKVKCPEWLSNVSSFTNNIQQISCSDLNLFSLKVKSTAVHTDAISMDWGVESCPPHSCPPYFVRLSMNVTLALWGVSMNFLCVLITCVCMCRWNYGRLHKSINSLLLQIKVYSEKSKKTLWTKLRLSPLLKLNWNLIKIRTGLNPLWQWSVCDNWYQIMSY